MVLEDADIEKAAVIGARARMANAGQSCIAAKRFIVHSSVQDKFIELFLENLRKIKSGDPEDPATNIGPLASLQQAEAVEKQVQRSVVMGARILTGAKRTDAFYTPTILLDVLPGMPVFEEEVFGPVAPIIAARDNDRSHITGQHD